ncbi:hypothetical protein QJS04_geneDACA011221 [Acorus gramineus]|uniref:Protein kinase domain-containing protein n=1 Tax=Acorus gramineus TaxID=55184 RepID=A0AAV9AM03_ACOGR|nr:hypothetical protein QJS04_geneDACA011221 [Acorus gramineus]
MGNCLTFKSPSSIQGVRHNRVSATPLMLGITQSEEVILLSSNLKSFTFNELKTATQNFHPDNLIEEGRFGFVFKGWITVKNGTRMEVIVRSIKYRHLECMVEIKYLGKLHHPNIARLIGYYGEDANRLLVYEFMPNGSLARRLFGNSQPLSWNL